MLAEAVPLVKCTEYCLGDAVIVIYCIGRYQGDPVYY